jgi:hypothetical protein
MSLMPTILLNYKSHPDHVLYRICPVFSSDGWRKKSCMSGAALVSFTVMGNSGARLPPKMADPRCLFSWLVHAL